jgi:hypothetical protein
MRCDLLGRASSKLVGQPVSMPPTLQRFVDALVELATKLYEFIDATQEEANPFPDGGEEHTTFRYFWYAGYIATTIGLSLLGAAAAKAVVQGLKASTLLSKISGALGDLADATKVAQYVNRLKSIGIVNSRILVGAVFTTAFAGAAYVWPEIFGEWFSAYLGGAFVFVSVYGLGPSGVSQNAMKGVARGVRAGLLDGSPDLHVQYARYLDRGIDDYQLLVDYSAVWTRRGFSDSLARFRSALAAADFARVDDIVAEWRAIARGTGHRFDDIDLISTGVDSAGRPVKTSPFTELDGKLRNGDIIEVKNSASADSIIDDYLNGPQIAKHRALLGVYGGRQILLYVRADLRETIQAYLDAQRISDVRLYGIP